MTLSRAELDATPEGWAEELALMEAGFEAAVAVVEKRQRGKHAAPQEDQGQPVYGMPGRRFTPGQGVR